MKKRTLYLFLFLIAGSSAWAQYDSNYVRKFSNRLIISLFQTESKYTLSLDQPLVADTGKVSAPSWISPGNRISGFSIDYDKLSLSLGFKTPRTDADIQKRGKTVYNFLMASVSWKKFRFEGSYRNYKGFYDEKTPNYDTAFTPGNTVPYHLNPSLSSRDLRIKTLYFVNRKGRFNYNSAYSYTYRQLKTAGSFMLVGNLYHMDMASDTGFLPGPAVPFYDDWGKLKSYQAFGFSINPGYSFNLILGKRFFLNLTASLGTSLYHRTLKTLDDRTSMNNWAFQWAAGDFRAALGFSNNNFFMALNSKVDNTLFNQKRFNLATSFYSGGFVIGYRFPFRERNWLKWLKETEVYKVI